MDTKNDFYCPYHNEEVTKDFLTERRIEACKEECPIDKKVCYRWSICYPAKQNKIIKTN
jgi:hypothetical protein